MVIDSFKNEFGFLSNFYEAPIYINGERYASVEHAYQAHKTLDVDLKRIIRESKTPWLAKKLGRGATLRPDWDDVKLDLMLSFLREKFRNPMLREMLVATEGYELIEGNTWGDRFWGVYKGFGENHLGKLLMKVREEVTIEKRQDDGIFRG